MSNDDRSREASLEQLENISLMSVTFDVSRGDGSREVSFEQPLSI